MSTFREAVGVATKSAICTVLAGAEAASYVSRIGIPAPGSQAVINTVNSARRAVCDNPDPVVDTPTSDYTGGQCSTIYTIMGEASWQRTSEFNCSDVDTLTDIGWITNDLVGPLGAISIVTSEGPEGDCDGPTTRNEVFIETANGLVSIFRPGAQYFIPGTFQIYDIEVIRPDGEPDDCGDPDTPPISPYSPVTISRDVTYNDNSETEITEQGDFTINAPVLIGGNIIAPVSIDLGGVEIPVELNLSTGDITFEFEGGDAPAPIDEDDDGGDDTPPSPDDEPGIEEDSLIYGLIVYSTPTTGGGSVTSEVAQGDAPVLLLPRTGNVWFQIPVGDRVTWTGPIPVQSQNQLVRVPDGMAASGYRLFPNTGWQLSVVKMGKPPCGCVSG